jgi:hypothetical protein
MPVISNSYTRAQPHGDCLDETQNDLRLFSDCTIVEDLMVTLPLHGTTPLYARCPCLKMCRLPHPFGVELCRLTECARGEMKLLDVCILGVVSIVLLSRFPSPLEALKRLLPK